MSATGPSQAKWHSKVLWVVLVGLPFMMAIYQFGCDQFNWPKLPALLQMVSGVGWLFSALFAGLALQAFQVNQLAAKLRNLSIDPISEQQQLGNDGRLEQSVAAIKIKLDKTESEKELLRGSLEALASRTDALQAQSDALQQKFLHLDSTNPYEMIVRKRELEEMRSKVSGELGRLEALIGVNKTLADQDLFALRDKLGMS